ncbi:MAG: aromatic ring-hydroxylating dioxygenase subunit alpha [Acidimicrobiales bacterium]|nr:aromatic ring-hydroxylating dioxygenase subunit alpha [Acidimicrobiales bacterium]|tara:strand:+ start:1130 stop:2140 length:1011 start_codon:yes stop_codon:yes gene_type:complete
MERKLNYTDGFVDKPVLRNYWYAVALCDEVESNPISVKLLNEDFVIWRESNGGLIAAPERCPHRQAPLSHGHLENGCLVCPYHGWTFSEFGKCVNIPSAADGVPIPSKAHLDTAEVIEKYGLIWLCPGKPLKPLFELEEELDPSFRRINTEVQKWEVAATRMVDNFLDITHFPYVHAGTFGAGQETKVPNITLEYLDEDFFGYRYDILAANPEEAKSTSGSNEESVERSMSSGFNLPLTVRSTIAYKSGLEHIILLLSTPIDETSSYFTFVIWRNDDFTVPADEVISFDRAIGEEDRVMLEKLSGVMPLDRTALVNVQSDKATVEWRRQLSKLING